MLASSSKEWKKIIWTFIKKNRFQMYNCALCVCECLRARVFHWFSIFHHSHVFFMCILWNAYVLFHWFNSLKLNSQLNRIESIRVDSSRIDVIYHVILCQIFVSFSTFLPELCSTSNLQTEEKNPHCIHMRIEEQPLTLPSPTRYCYHYRQHTIITAIATYHCPYSSLYI